jgi:twitching motility protein PilT
MALQAVLAQRLVPRVGGGRVAAYEILMGTPAVTNLIREGKVRQIRNVLATGTRDGMQVLEQHLGQLVAAGVVTLEDAMAVSVHPEDISGLGTAQPAPTA